METIADLYEFIQITTAGPDRPGKQIFRYVQLTKEDRQIAKQGIKYLHAYLLRFNLGQFFNLIEEEEEQVLFLHTLKQYGL